MVSGNLEDEENMELLAEEDSCVDREYIEAFRTTSFMDLWNHVQTRMGERRRRSIRRSRTFSISLSFSSIDTQPPANSSEYLLEPAMQAGNIDHSGLHDLAISYLKATCEASSLCEVLLRNTHQVRACYRIIRRVILLANKVGNGENTEDHIYDAMYKEFSSLLKLRNPMMTISPTYFQNLDNGLNLLLCALNTELRKKNRKREKFARYTTFCLQTDLAERHSAQLKVAAEGVYALIVALGTIGRIVNRLQDETEHNRYLADMCVRKGHRGIMMEVARECGRKEACFLEQLKELEDQTCLCFLNITRYRKQFSQQDSS